MDFFAPDALILEVFFFETKNFFDLVDEDFFGTTSAPSNDIDDEHEL